VETLIGFSAIGHDGPLHLWKEAAYALAKVGDL